MKKLIFLFAFILIFGTCKKKPEPEPEPLAPVPVPTSGPISGKVKYYDQYGATYTTGLNNTTVSIDGQNTQAITNESGRYTLNDVPAGTYTLTFTKPGCGLIKMQGIVYKIGDTISYNAAVADKPAFAITNAYVKDTSWFSTAIPGIYYKAYSNSTDAKATAVAIIGRSKDLNIADPTSYENFAPAVEISKSTDYNRFISYTFLRDTYDYWTGQTIYVKIYPVSAIAASYIDGKLSKPVYTAFGAAFPTTFTLAMP
jgi:hypothetical protein